MIKFKPFENDSQSMTIGNGNGITIENGIEEIIIYGDITINKDTDPAVIDSLIDVFIEIKKNLNKKSTNKLKN